MPGTVHNAWHADPVWMPWAGKFGSGLQLFRAHVPDFSSRLSRLQQLLSAEELARAGRYHRAANRESFVVTRGLLRLLLGAKLSRDGAALVFRITPREKPFLPEGGATFNVSHAGDYALIAVAPAGAAVGVDVEMIRRDKPFDELLPVVCSEAESAEVRTAADPSRRFFQYWTRKEALLKATGEGMVDHLPAVPAGDGVHAWADRPDLSLVNFPVARDYLGAVAATPGPALDFFTLDPTKL